MENEPGLSDRVGSLQAVGATDPGQVAVGGQDPSAESPSPLRSSHTSNFPAILQHLNASLVVSTYQAGKMILVRPEPNGLNTHFRGFAKPMGVAVHGNRMAIGGALDIWEFHNVPAAAKAPEGEQKADCCFLPRRSHTTGDIQIHEMEWGFEGLAVSSDAKTVASSSADSSSADSSSADSSLGGGTSGMASHAGGVSHEDSGGFSELWFVNTRFSCLCTRSDEHSFVPQWRPPFISSYTPEDRCHLNGLAMVDGRPKYVTALGESDQPAGWRESKADGGILIDVPSGEILVRGLSMPHSPRYYNGRLWVLNSGEGGMGTVDLSSGQYEEVTRLPGFTRGLAFFDRFAFVGLSQVRESAVFSGIKIAETPEEERWSGVAVVDIVAGQCVAWLRFEDAVQEVFAVSLLQGSTWPDLVNDDAELLNTAYVLPDEALREVPESWRSP